MPLGEAVLYLKHAIKRVFGPNARVRLVDPIGPEGRGFHWTNEKPLPLVILDGEVVFKGDFSIRQIVQEVARRNNGRNNA